MQILQPSRTAECLAAYIRVVGYRVVAEVDRVGEGGQPVREVELGPRHFRIAVCVGKFGMHARVRPNAARERSGPQLQRVRDYVADIASSVVNGRHVTFYFGLSMMLPRSCIRPFSLVRCAACLIHPTIPSLTDASDSG